jgi:hypothetical protein
MCKLCRGRGECALCRRELYAAARRRERRRSLARVGHRAGIGACIAATALAGVGAALIPETPPPSMLEAHTVIVARGEVRFVADAVARWADHHGSLCPPSLGTLRQEGYLMAPALDPWGEPLLYGCVDQPRSFVVLSKGPDRQAGTVDDITFSVP